MSAKASTQQGRRTPLSLSGTVTKPHPNKGGNNATNSSGNNSNGHTASISNKQDNKLQKEKNDQTLATNSDAKENPNKKQIIDKKQQQNDNKKSNEKSQNGASSNKQQQCIESKQQTLYKEKSQQQNGNDDKNINEKDKKEKPDKLDKPHEKSQKEDINLKEDKKVDQEKNDNKKEEKKNQDAKDDKKEGNTKSDVKIEQPESIKEDDKKSKEENNIKNSERLDEKFENVKILKEQPIQENAILTPTTPKSNSVANKTSNQVNKTPTKAAEKTPQKATPTNTGKTTFATKREETITIDDDIEMEPLAIESSPIKPSQQEVVSVKITPSATSTPGKILLPKRNSGVPKSDVHLAMLTEFSPDRRRTFSQISGRKSIRPISEYTPSKFQSNLQYRESYRRINTELDSTNTSMNVTVGSEAPNNLSFSFFGRGRKRDRTSPKHSQSAIGELQTDNEISPPKKARLDMHGFFSVVSSPLSLLRNRFSKASLQSSTPVKLHQILNTAEDEVEVQNVSGESVHEEIAKSDKDPAETSTTVSDSNDTTLGEAAKTGIVITIEDGAEDKGFKDALCEKACGMEHSDIKITETLLQPTAGDPMAKNKRCVVM